MNAQEAEKIVREACIAANPEIVELKFGCRFFFKGNNNGCVALSNDEWKRLHFMISLPMLEPKYDTLNRKDLLDEEALEIIGRPIRLADVLLALGNTEHRSEVGVNFDSDGAYIFYDDFENASGGKWNLLKDNLSDQSDETKLFLTGLLLAEPKS